MDNAEEIRPYWSEPAEILSAPQPAPVVQQRRAFYEERRILRLEAGMCPCGCPYELNDGSCDSCGWSLEAEQAEVRLRDRVEIPLPPHELPFDEYGPAEVDAA